MCEDHPTATEPSGTTRPPTTRRQALRTRRQVLRTRRQVLRTVFLLGAGASAVAVGAGRRRSVRAAVEPVRVMPGFDVLPRRSWGDDLPPAGTVPDEDDVRLLLVHHTASSNTWSAENTMRVAYQTHVRQKGWVDVCYHLFVARDGTVYEGRAGSLVRPKRADATGGSQGYSQLVCLLGDYTDELPTPAARASLVKCLAWLAVRSGVDTAEGATCSFTSKGSNRFAAGVEVSSPTIAPHRAMTFTACPGDAFAPHVDATLMRDVHQQRAAWRTGDPVPAVRLGPREP